MAYPEPVRSSRYGAGGDLAIKYIHRLGSRQSLLLDEMERLLPTDPIIADPAQHLDILAALKGRDSAAARETMRRHLAQTRTRILSRF